MNEDDNKLPEADQLFLATLDDIASNAIHAADPRQPIATLAAAFAAFIRGTRA